MNTVIPPHDTMRIIAVLAAVLISEVQGLLYRFSAVDAPEQTRHEEET